MSTMSIDIVVKFKLRRNENSCCSAAALKSWRRKTLDPGGRPRVSLARRRPRVVRIRGLYDLLDLLPSPVVGRLPQKPAELDRRFFAAIETHEYIRANQMHVGKILVQFVQLAQGQDESLLPIKSLSQLQSSLPEIRTHPEGLLR